MFTKFDEFEVQEFFEKKPVCIGECEEGNWIYTLEEGLFKLVMLVDTYRAIVEVSVSYQDNLVCREIYKNVEEIRKSDDKTLRIIIAKENSVILKKGRQLGAIMEGE